MKKTKVIVKKQKQKQPRQKQKQKQNVSVNVNIDQSKRTTQRKPKGDKMTNQSTTMASGENYVKSNPFSYLPPVVYQPPFNQVYGQLQPIGNTSDSMSRMITNGQEYNSVVPRNNVANDSLYNSPQTFNIMNLALEARKIQDEINSGVQTANAYNKLTQGNAKVEFIDGEQDDEQDDEEVPALVSNNEDVEEKVSNEPEKVQLENLLPPSPPPPSPIITRSRSQLPSQSQSQSQVIEQPIDEEKVNRTYLSALSAQRVRDYAKKLEIQTQIPDEKKVGEYKNKSKNDLIGPILKRLKENKKNKDENK